MKSWFLLAEFQMMFPVVAEQRQTSAIERQWTSSQQQGFAIKTDI